MGEIHIGAMLILGTQFFTLLGAVATFAMSLRNRRLGEENKQAIREVHVMVNNRLTELLAATKIASHGEGVVQGKAEQKAEEKLQR